MFFLVLLLNPNSISLQVFQKPGHRRQNVLGSVNDLSKMFKTQTLRFLKIGSSRNTIIVSVKLIPMSSSTENSSWVSFNDELGTTKPKTQERSFQLNIEGEYADIPISPFYIKEKGMKRPACKIIVSINQQVLKQWTVTVYNPHYGSRLERDNSKKTLFFSNQCQSWKIKQCIIPKIQIEKRVTIYPYSAREFELKEEKPVLMDIPQFQDIKPKTEDILSCSATISPCTLWDDMCKNIFLKDVSFLDDEFLQNM